jgi:lauroyl/myristoyl acyltransferase
MNESHRWMQRFAVKGVIWRRYVDWTILNVPFYFHPLLIFFSTLLFFFFATRARKAVCRHFAIPFPDSPRLAIYLRAFQTFYNFARALTDAAIHRLLGSPFNYEFEGEKLLNELASSRSAIVLTAHLGNYDLGAALFAEKFQREIRLVRAPEPDPLAAQHVDLSLKRSSGGAIKIDYSTTGAPLSLDLLAALRRGEIISIQGDRIVGDVNSLPATLFGQELLLPSGPFVLSLVAEVPIYPLFIVRRGYRKYRIIVCEPIVCLRNNPRREDDIALPMQQWSGVLEEMIKRYWGQWYAFTPVF